MKMFVVELREQIVTYKTTVIEIEAGDNSAMWKKYTKGDGKILSTNEGKPIVGMISKRIIFTRPSPSSMLPDMFEDQPERPTRSINIVTECEVVGS